MSSSTSNKLCLVTGANGFVGRRLCETLLSQGYRVRAAFRNPPEDSYFHSVDQVFITDIGPNTNWNEALKSVDCVIHLAARVHVLQETSDDPIYEFRKTNTAGTMHLASEASKAGVRRFIYISTIKVNGEKTTTLPFTADDQANPQDPYGISKAEAEYQLFGLTKQTNMDVVILRPPLIYGPHVKGNFLRLVKLVEKGIPLPFSMITNRRSILFLDNFVDLIVKCIDHQGASNQVLLVSDNTSCSTKTLVEYIASNLQKPLRLIPIPVSLLKFAGILLGQLPVIERLCDSLEVDSNKTKNHLNWSPPYGLEDGIKLTIKWYLENKSDLV